MSNMSLWKRVGGWLRRGNNPSGGPEAVHLDAEGLLVSPEGHDTQNTGPVSAMLTRMHRKDPQAAALEEGFSQLSDALDAVARTMERGEMHSAALSEKMTELTVTVRQFPDAIARNEKSLASLSGTLDRQVQGIAQLNETLESIPATAQKQLDQLRALREQCQIIAQNGQNLHEAVRAMTTHTEKILGANADQTALLEQHQRTAQQHNDMLETLLAAHRKRLTWIAILLALGLLVAVSTAAWSLWQWFGGTTPSPAG